MGKRLLIINSALNCGSTGRIAEQTGLLAKDNGWDVYFAHGLRYANPSQLKALPVSTKWEETCHIVKSVLADGHGLGSTRATRRLIDQIKEIHPDVIHIHNLHGYYLNYRILFEYLASTSIPIVWTLHDCWSFTGHCSHFDFVGCDGWKDGCRVCRQKKSYPTSLFASRSSRNYELKKQCFAAMSDRITLVPVSYWLENFVKQSFLSECNVHTIHNGVDIEIFHTHSHDELQDMRNRLAIGANKVIMGCAAPWGEKKGYSDFMKLRKLLPDDYSIVMVGLSADQKKEVEANGIIGVCRTESQAELAKYYSLADVFVNPTYEDNFPTVNLEALACGTPVVTYRTGGSPEAVDENTGIVIDKGDVEGLAEAIRRIINNHDLFSAETCRRRAEENFNKDVQFQKYIYLYEQVLAEKR